MLKKKKKMASGMLRNRSGEADYIMTEPGAAAKTRVSRSVFKELITGSGSVVVERQGRQDKGLDLCLQKH